MATTQLSSGSYAVDRAPDGAMTVTLLRRGDGAERSWTVPAATLNGALRFLRVNRDLAAALDFLTGPTGSETT